MDFDPIPNAKPMWACVCVCPLSHFQNVTFVKSEHLTYIRKFIIKENVCRTEPQALYVIECVAGILKLNINKYTEKPTVFLLFLFAPLSPTFFFYSLGWIYKIMINCVISSFFFSLFPSSLQKDSFTKFHYSVESK